MNSQDPLANLHPLREPDAISWWPLAPGWWLLLALGAITAAALAYWLYQRRRHNAYRRHALRQLDALQATHRKCHNDRAYLEGINALLKSVALHAGKRTELAAQHGEAWRSFLNSELPSAMQLQPAYTQAVYQRHCPALDLEQVHRAAQHWIKHHKGQL